MRVIAIFFTLCINLVLQSTLFQYIEIINIKPNTSILLIISYAILRGDLEGSIVGFFCGLLQDILFGRYVGLYALLGFFLGYFCGKPFKDFYRENYMIPLFLAAAGTVIYQSAFYFLSFLFAGKSNYLYFFNKVILPETVYTTVLAMPVYRVIYFINKKLEMREDESRKLF